MVHSWYEVRAGTSTLTSRSRSRVKMEAECFYFHLCLVKNMYTFLYMIKTALNADSNKTSSRLGHFGGIKT